MSYNRVATVRHSRVIDRSPAYYAWIILVVATLAATLIGPGQIYAVSVFIDHFVVDLGISRGLASTLYTAGTLTASFALPYLGHQVDKRGSRLTIAIISFALGLASINMGFVRGALMLWVGFVALQMLGQGSLSLVSINVINQWWVRRWGIALLSGGCSPTYWPGSYPSTVGAPPTFCWVWSSGSCWFRGATIYPQPTRRLLSRTRRHDAWSGKRSGDGSDYPSRVTGPSHW